MLAEDEVCGEIDMDTEHILGQALDDALERSTAGVNLDLSAVAFLDGGNVWEKQWDFDFNDVRYDVGPGLRYHTPVGPIRLDIGYQLNPIEGLAPEGEVLTRRFRFHFSIGQAF